MKKSFLTGAILLLSLLIASCSSDNNPNPVPPTPPAEPDPQTARDFIQKYLDDSKQEFNGNASSEFTVTGRGGVSITFPAGSFTKDGAPVTGNVVVELYEMLKPSDIIFSGTNTNYYFYVPSYLATDGFINVNVRVGNQYVDEYLSQNMRISVPTNMPDGTITEIWVGEVGMDNTNEQEQFAWREINEDEFVWGDDGQGEGFPSRVEAQNKRFGFNMGRLGWCNCDVWWDDAAMTTLTATLTGNVGQLAGFQGYGGNTFVFLHAVSTGGRPVLAQLYTPIDAIPNVVQVASYENSIPVGTTGRLLAFSIIDGVYSFSMQQITVTENMNVTLDLRPVTRAQMQENIESLDGFSN